MLDPIPPPPEWLQASVRPLAEYLSLPVFAHHIHEIIFFFVFYQIVQSVLSPMISSALFPKVYPQFTRRTRLSWDIHVVSLVQSTLVNSAALWVMFVDEERKSMSPAERVYGYTGACGLVQAMATGYFMYDFIVSLIHVRIFGVGLLAHAVSALAVFSLGFRPFVNPYGPTFILYELSSPFLNFHWFFDKLNMTGSRAQWYNGMLLLCVFFGCRLVWGTWQSVRVFTDIFKSLWQSRDTTKLGETFDAYTAIFGGRNAGHCLDGGCKEAVAEISKFSQYNINGPIPTWLVFTYLTSNLILNALNFFWFSKMIEAVMKRFKGIPAAPTKETVEAVSKTLETDANEIVLEAASALEEDGRIFVDGGMIESSDDGKPKFVSSANAEPVEGARRRKA